MYIVLVYSNDTLAANRTFEHSWKRILNVTRAFGAVPFDRLHISICYTCILHIMQNTMSPAAMGLCDLACIMRQLNYTLTYSAHGSRFMIGFTEFWVMIIAAHYLIIM